MAKNGKKAKKLKLRKGSRGKVRGFDERRVSAGGLVKQLAKAAASTGLDALSARYPALVPARQTFKAVAGFDERAVSSGSAGATGGMTVKTMDAPVAFARNNMQTGWKSLGFTKDGGELWEFRDLAFANSAATSVNVTTSGTANSYTVLMWGLSPISGGIFPNFKQAAAIWERWRPVKLVLHFCHFAATSVQAAVMLAYSSDTLEDGDYATSQELMALENSVQGNAYEDFSLTIQPPEWRKGEWFYTDYFETGAEVSGLRQAFAGDVMIATDMCPSTSATLGRWYVELLFEVCDKRPPIAEVTALFQLKSMLGVLPPEHRRPFLMSFIGARVVDVMLKSFGDKPAVPSLARVVGLSEDARAFMELFGVPVSQTVAPKRVTASQVLEGLGLLTLEDRESLPRAVGKTPSLPTASVPRARGQ